MSRRPADDGDSMVFLEPWRVLSAERRERIEAEIARELAPGHVLFGRAIVSLAARSDQDDVLFEAPGLGYAVVHLMWSGSLEASPSSPRTELFASLAEWRERVMQPDNDAFSI